MIIVFNIPFTNRSGMCVLWARAANMFQFWICVHVWVHRIPMPHMAYHYHWICVPIWLDMVWLLWRAFCFWKMLQNQDHVYFFSSNAKNKCRRIALFIRNWRGMSANAALQKYQMLNRFHSISSTFIRKSETMNYSFKHENAGVNYDHIFT